MKTSNITNAETQSQSTRHDPGGCPILPFFQVGVCVHTWKQQGGTKAAGMRRGKKMVEQESRGFFKLQLPQFLSLVIMTYELSRDTHMYQLDLVRDA